MTEATPIPKNLREQVIERVAAAPDEDVLFLHDVLLFAEKDRLWREIQEDAKAERAQGRLDNVPELIRRYRAGKKGA